MSEQNYNKFTLKNSQDGPQINNNNKESTLFNTRYTENNVTNFIERRNRILHHIQREHFMISFPNIQQFKDRNHAIECLLPYHIFLKGTPEDYLYSITPKDLPSYDIEKICAELYLIVDSIEKNFESFINLGVNLLEIEENKHNLQKYKEQIGKFHKINAEKKKIEDEAILKKKDAMRRSTVLTLKITRPDIKQFKHATAKNGVVLFKKEK